MSNIYRLWGFALVVKLIVSYFLPLSFDESYYWVWGRNLQLSYFDHPPFVSWLYFLGQSFEGFGNAVRWPGIILGHLTLIIWLKILSPYFNVEKIRWWLLLALFTPLFGMGSLIITPDIPLMFFWTLSLWCLIKCQAKPSYFWFGALGLAMGLGFTSKYHIVVLAPLGFLWLGKTKALSLRSVGHVMWSLVFFALGGAPVLIWNLQNDFISFAFQLNHGLSEPTWTPWWPTKFIIDQILILFPPVAYFCLKKKESSHALFLKIMGWGPLIFFFLATFKADSEANWTIAGYPALLALALIDNNKTWWIKTSLAVWISIFIIVFSESVHPWLPASEQKLKTNEFTRFNPIIDTLNKNPEIQPVYAHSFQMASKLSYQMKRPIYKLKGLNRVDFYDFHKLAKPSKSPFYVIVETNTSLPSWVKKEEFQITRTYGINEKYKILKVERP